MNENESTFNEEIQGHVSCILMTGETYTRNEEIKDGIIKWFESKGYKYYIRETKTFGYNIVWS